MGVFVIFEHFWGKNHSQNDSAFWRKKTQFLIRTCIFWYCDSQLKQLVLRFMICFLDPKAPCSRLFERIFHELNWKIFSYEHKRATSFKYSQICVTEHFSFAKKVHPRHARVAHQDKQRRRCVTDCPLIVIPLFVIQTLYCIVKRHIFIE